MKSSNRQDFKLNGDLVSNSIDENLSIMVNSDNDKKLSCRPKLRIGLRSSDLRKGPKDRRNLHTYIANDRRSGIADRRSS